MRVIIVSHPSRAAHVAKLQSVLNVVTTVVDTVNARSGHLTALKIAAAHPDERVAIMEDDAVPVVGFSDLADMWAAAHPEALISFYLGTNRPTEYQGLIDGRIERARSFGDAYIEFPTLIHGVCYSLPPGAVQGIIDKMTVMSRTVPADYAIGGSWRKPVVYPLESLVQHRDEASIEQPMRKQQCEVARVARHLAGPLMFN